MPDERTWNGWLLKRVFSRERRKSPRKRPEALAAYFWDGAEPTAHIGFGTLSTSGLYLITSQRWYVGTMITMTLQKQDVADEHDKDRTVEVVGKRRPNRCRWCWFCVYDAPSVRSTKFTKVADINKLTRFVHGLEGSEALEGEMGRGCGAGARVVGPISVPGLIAPIRQREEIL